MRLVNLVVKEGLSNQIIRNIPFNKSGLSLIVDETNSKESGSNIGKTTAVKVIDLCLGAQSASSLYKEKDTGENHIVKDFLEKNKVFAELTSVIDDKKYTFKRCLYKNGKSSINGEEVKNITEYREKLNNIIFKNANNKPTFRQLIAKFIRLENSNESSLLKYLGTYCKNYQYQAIYSYLYGIDTSKSKNVDILSLNEAIDKDIEAIFRKNGVGSLSEFEAKINLMKEEVNKFKKAYSEVTVIEEYKDKTQEIDDILTKINKLEGIYAKGKLKVDLMKEKIKREQEKIFSVDHKLLKKLYNETKIYIDKPLMDFKELEQFHNGMVNKRIGMLKESLKELSDDLKKVEGELNNLRIEYEANYVEFNIEIKDKFEEKYNEFSINKIKLENFMNDYNYIELKQKEKKDNLSKKVEENSDDEEKEDIKKILNKYFKVLTDEIIGEPFAILLNENDDEFPIKIIGMNGKPGTGIKKAMITCFDLAHINLIINKGYHMPVFEIHDKLENIDLKELNNIIRETRKFTGQYIFPILNDRIDQLGIKDEEIVLRLSTTDKFFGI
ncbi:hypothetical protein CLOBY_35360 [Clostridium saccharobutylicum]|uniref:DUF2326 domain-containing protein n=1 Tax=Clostridium saccharobutylicum TaxID=169679 RepID=UPI000983F4F6|nr:DUF2326 domain-containing protein [Clostridium saccharobutylicum]AQS11380.1 hypothetical protein CLOBY_35360 [Clostridium saccharobutylicum]MBC2438002.1 DUF2326 domain-containing protein [Clostridium saccharobutylicum]NSB88777.1 uncharacterized protein YydD (DUF2326 family) [Clostridium saccharobutylicum]NYC30645.1 uncharacterized protein YydD (DUF2326 family) [Clostridium saccharobutylicum]OOM16999.1 hypothetical protein CLSAB_21130 [Clostridium saccharobutylicum]